MTLPTSSPRSTRLRTRSSYPSSSPSSSSTFSPSSSPTSASTAARCIRRALHALSGARGVWPRSKSTPRSSTGSASLVALIKSQVRRRAPLRCPSSRACSPPPPSSATASRRRGRPTTLTRHRFTSPLPSPSPQAPTPPTQRLPPSPPTPLPTPPPTPPPRTRPRSRQRTVCSSRACCCDGVTTSLRRLLMRPLRTAADATRRVEASLRTARRLRFAGARPSQPRAAPTW
mmetsp:Transcript_20225/g.43800  ORF Transcript_20225/g.43800 Transcript_20225/m.43800 type:complete len:230 (+) Transcript_20225:419-1108(+)